jgi:exopolysaccharide production protein ExoQ
MSFTRFVLEVMIISSIVLPAQLAARSADMMRGLFLCFAFACVLNVFFVLDQPPLFQRVFVGDVLQNVAMGYPGYFPFKGILGECAAITLLLCLYEFLQSGLRRVGAIVVAGIAIYLMIASQSKGSLGLALLAPFLAGFTLIGAKRMRVSPAVILLPIPFCYAVLSFIFGDLINRISWHIYGNYTLSGRTIIWDFVNYEIAQRPLLGWGYQSFWLVGPDAPSIVDAPGWVKSMPSAHNGYLDTMIDTGYVGFLLFMIFIFATLHAIGRVAHRESARAWLLLTLALFVILTNFLESTWMHGMDMMWLIFVVVAAEAGRYWQSERFGVSAPVTPDPLPASRRPDLPPVWTSTGLGRLRKRRV